MQKAWRVRRKKGKHAESKADREARAAVRGGKGGNVKGLLYSKAFQKPAQAVNPRRGDR